MNGVSFTSPTQSVALRVTVAAIWVHAAVMLLHGIAHLQLHIDLSKPAAAFVALVIGIAPFIGLGMLRRKAWLGGALVVTFAMGASLIFGYWNHFFAPGADHIAQLPEVFWSIPFRINAWLLTVTEGIATLSSLALLVQRNNIDMYGDSR